MSGINFPDIRIRTSEAMDDLFFQEFLAAKGIMERRDIPPDLRTKLEEFSLGRRPRQVVAGILLDLGPWVVTPKTLTRVVTRCDSDSFSNKLVRMWMLRLKEEFPELQEYLNNFHGIGYSLEVSRLSLEPTEAIILYELYRAKNNMMEEFRLRNSLKILSPSKFESKIDKLNKGSLHGTGLKVYADQYLGSKMHVLASIS